MLPAASEPKLLELLLKKESMRNSLPPPPHYAAYMSARYFTQALLPRLLINRFIWFPHISGLAVRGFARREAVEPALFEIGTCFPSPIAKFWTIAHG